MYINALLAIGPLRLELWMAVSHHVSGGNQVLVLYESTKCYHLQTRLSSP